MTAVAERLLPHSLDAEQSVLGAVLVYGPAWDEVADRLTGAEFFRDAHRRIWKAMASLVERRIPVDHLTLCEELRRVGELDECGGPQYVSSLGDGTPRATNVKYYAQIVRDKHATRQVISLANKLLADAYEDDQNPTELVNSAERGLLELSQHAVPGDLVPSSDIVRSMFPVIEELQQTRRPVIGLTSGFDQLDHYMKGLQPGHLVIVGGRTSQGKSVIAQQIALHVSKSVPVAFFSVEMSLQEQAFRALAQLAKVDGHLLQCGQLGMHGLQDVGLAMQEFSDRQFWLDESSSISAIQIRSRARRLKARHGLGLIVVDYLQLLQHPRGDNNEQRVAATSRMLKVLARELSVPVLALCQLSRQVESRQDKRPTLADLRESGAIEQDADEVLLIYRPPVKDDGAVKTIPASELIIAKQRNGPLASVEMRWIGEQYRFEEIAS